ncbi:hypothetical protein PQI23_04310 [Leucobacter sp. USCH14]|uniref:hypothetical protein n=1 Tax=Leucobacter sp. USCH14 TaxID=3024838 RepID=UPI0030AF50FA
MGERLQWKKVVSIWIGMYPVNVATSWVITMLPWWGGVSLPARSAIVVTVVAPVMCLVMMPAVTRLLAPWLGRRTAHARHERELCARLDSLAAAQDDADPARAWGGLGYAEGDRGGEPSLQASVGRSRWSDSTRWSSEPGSPA